jgi:hypothetical protein
LAGVSKTIIDQPTGQGVVPFLPLGQSNDLPQNQSGQRPAPAPQVPQQGVRR